MEKKFLSFVVVQIVCFFLAVLDVQASALEFNFTPANYSVAQIQAALDEAGEDTPIVVNFASGTYEISSVLRLHSNTTINAQGATFVRSGEGLVTGHALMINTDKELKNTIIQGSGYTLSHDIVINGGIYDGGDVSKAQVPCNVINFGHASNITIKNASFKNCYGAHLIEFSGVKDSSIINCTFDGTDFRYNEEGSNSEAIQLDICGQDLNGNYTPDNTPCKNIVVQSNTIKNYPRGIGNHNVVSGHYNSDISIIGNKISYTSKKEKQAIFLNYFVNTVVTGNVIEGYEVGIQALAGDNITIKGNTIANTGGNAISVRGTKNIKEISNNKITKPGSNGISIIEKTTVNTLASNSITACANNAIVLDDSGTKVVAITGNTINKAKGNAISVNEGASASQIVSNTVTDTTGNVIRIAGNTTLIDSNTINSTKENAIIVCKSTVQLEAIKNNKITATKGKAISITEGNVNSITKNTITDTDENPIKVSGKNSAVELIAENVLKNCGLHAIAITDGAVVKEVKTNDITDVTQHAIAVNSKAKVTRVEGNTISDIGKSGIYTSTSGSKITTVTKNKISNTGSHAVSATSKAYIGTLKANEITSSKGYGISAVSNSNIKKILSNKLSKCKNHAIYFGKGKVKTEINKNTFKSNKKSAVYIGKGVSATIKNNSISKYSDKYQQIYTVGKKETRVMLTMKAITSKTKKVSGTAPAKSKITITIGNKKYTAKASSKGKFSVKITKPKKGTKITTKLVDKNKNTLTATAKVK